MADPIDLAQIEALIERKLKIDLPDLAGFNAKLEEQLKVIAESVQAQVNAQLQAALAKLVPQAAGVFSTALSRHLVSGLLAVLTAVLTMKGYVIPTAVQQSVHQATPTVLPVQYIPAQAPTAGVK